MYKNKQTISTMKASKSDIQRLMKMYTDHKHDTVASPLNPVTLDILE